MSTHAHLWQSQLKGWHSNHTLVEYNARGLLLGHLLRNAQPHLGPARRRHGVGRCRHHHRRRPFPPQLGAQLPRDPSVSCTRLPLYTYNDLPKNVVAKTPSAKTAIQALSTSGLRTVYCYCPPWRTSSFSPLKLEEDPVPSSDTRDAFAALASPAKPHGNGRVTLGFAQDNIYLPPAKLQSIYARVRGGGGTGRAQLITTHAQGGPAFGSRPPAMSILGGGCA